MSLLGFYTYTSSVYRPILRGSCNFQVFKTTMGPSLHPTRTAVPKDEADWSFFKKMRLRRGPQGYGGVIDGSLRSSQQEVLHDWLGEGIP